MVSGWRYYVAVYMGPFLHVGGLVLFFSKLCTDGALWLCFLILLAIAVSVLMTLFRIVRWIVHRFWPFQVPDRLPEERTFRASVLNKIFLFQVFTFLLIVGHMFETEYDFVRPIGISLYCIAVALMVLDLLPFGGRLVLKRDHFQARFLWRSQTHRWADVSEFKVFGVADVYWIYFDAPKATQRQMRMYPDDTLYSFPVYGDRRPESQARLMNAFRDRALGKATWRPTE